jgi:hypothetical protein
MSHEKPSKSPISNQGQEQRGMAGICFLNPACVSLMIWINIWYLMVSTLETFWGGFTAVHLPLFVYGNAKVANFGFDIKVLIKTQGDPFLRGMSN